MKFTGNILTFGNNSLSHGPYIIIPDDIVQEMLKITTDKRVKCTLNNTITVSRAMTLKDNFYYLLLNKEVLKKCNCTIGGNVIVELQPDTSKYGIDITEEMEEVLFSDPEGNNLFQKLTPGMQRSLIYMINKIKTSQLRIERSFVILEHLKKNKGKVNSELLHQDFKDYRIRMKF